MKIRVEPCISVLRAALEDRAASVESAFRESLRNLTPGTHARALGRLAAIVRTAWLQAWLRELRAKANGLARIEFAPAPPQAALHPTAIAEIILVSKDGPTLTLQGEAPEWLFVPEPADAPTPELSRLREITGLRWSSPQSLQRFVIELHELCLTLYATAQCEHAVRHLGLTPPRFAVGALLQPVLDGPSPRYLLRLQ